jgi:hypothetical protein
VPLPIALLFAPLMGVLLAWAGRGELLRHEGPYVVSRPFWIVCIFAALIELPVFGFFQGFYADWSYAYLFSNVPSLIDGALVLAACILTPVAFSLCIKAATLSEFDVVSRSVLLLGGALLGVLLFGWKRFSVLGTTLQYSTQTGLRTVAEGRFSLVLVLAWIALGLGIAITWRELSRTRAS